MIPGEGWTIQSFRIEGESIVIEASTLVEEGLYTCGLQSESSGSS